MHRSSQRRRARFFGDYEQRWADEKLAAGAADGAPGQDIPHGTDEESERTTRAKEKARDGAGASGSERRDETRLEGDAAVTRDTQDSADAPVKRSER